MTVTLEPYPTWPDGEAGKVLLNCTISTSVDEVFEELFGSYPQTQAKLHKLRNDTNCAESPWVSQRHQLPAQQFVWPAPPAGADPGTPAQDCYRKVRFEAAASIASKAFNSEEIQHLLQYAPGSHYQLQTEVYTTAMYGDQFTVISRYTLAASGPGKAQLHVLYAIAFKPTLSRLMKPMVAKGVDGGIRGSFSVLKKLLQEQYGLSDLPDTAPAPAIEAAPAVAAAEAAPAAAAAAAPGPLPAAAVAAAATGPAAAPGLFALADYVVYQELVASIVQVSDPQLVAKALAVCLAMVLINGLILLLRPVNQACKAAGSVGPAGLLSWLCWPLRLGLELPDSLGAVLGALLLVAVANKLLLVGVEVVAAALNGGSSPSVAASRAPSLLGAALSALSTAASMATPSTAASTQLPPVEPPPAAAATGPDSSSKLASVLENSGQQAQQRLSPQQQKSSPVAIPRQAGAAGAAGSGGGTGSGGGVEAALKDFGNVMTGWGRNLLGAGVVDSLSSNEGIKALVTGSWTKSADNLSANDAGQGPGSTPAPAADSNSRASSTNGHKRTTSFTATMDPSGLHIIEDYAAHTQQGQAGQLPQLAEEQSTAASSPASSQAAGPFAAAAAAGTAAPANGRRSAAKMAVGGRSASNSPARSGSPSKPAAGPSSNKMKRAGSKQGLSGADADTADAEALRPLLAASSADGAAAGQASSQAGSTTQEVPGQGQGASRPSTPVPGEDSPVPPLLASSSPVVVSGSRQQHQPVRSSKSVTFSRSPNTPDSSSALPGSHSAAALFPGSPGRIAGGSAPGAGAAAGDSNNSSRASSSLARRSASPMLYGASPPPETVAVRASGGQGVGRLSVMSASYEALSASSGSSGMGGVPAVEPGQEDADEVLVEVFEHERVQPFRGWGHTWPGHFLPSDKVGHWGDRSGSPGGAVSMLFDRVAPKLPPGWTWQDPEWTVDMTGADIEGCDPEGWAYGMDFSWLTWPPGPQMGKPGIKSFVRRRRWVRTRARLPPGEEPPEDAVGGGPEVSLSPVLLSPAARLLASQQEEGQGGQGGSPRSLPAGSRDSEGGFMAGLSSMGLVSQDSATAAAAAAGAMVSRFMKAVQDLPLAQRGSSAGSEFGLMGTSPPAVPAAAGPAGAKPASAAARDWPGQAGIGHAGAAAPTGGEGAPDSQAVAATGGSSTAAEAATTAAQAAAATPQQQRRQDGASGKGSNAGSSRQGGDSGNMSDSDSSSVNSDSPPPRPRLSEVMAELSGETATAPTATAATHQDAGLPQQAVAAPAAAAAAAATAGGHPDDVSPPEAASAGINSTLGDPVTQAPCEQEAAVVWPSNEQGEGASDETTAAASGTAAAAAAAAAPTPSSAEVGAAAPAAEDEAGAHTPQMHPNTEPSTTPQAAPVPALDSSGAAAAGLAVAEGAVAPAAAEQAPTAPPVMPHPSSSSSSSSRSITKPTAAAAAGSKAVPDTSISAPGAPDGGAPGAAAAGSAAAGPVDVPGASGHAAVVVGPPAGGAGVTATVPGLRLAGSAGSGASLGSGDWVWSAAEPVADTSSPMAAAGTSILATGAHPHAADRGAGTSSTGGALPASPCTRGPSGGGAARGIVRSGSGARGSRGKQSKLGAVPLRRSAEPQGQQHTTAAAGGSSSGGGAALSTGGAAAGSVSGAAAAGSSSEAGQASVPLAVSGIVHQTDASSSSSHAQEGGSAAAASAGAMPTSQPAQSGQGMGAGAVAARVSVSGDDMGSGMGWANSPDKRGSAAASHAARAGQQQGTSAEAGGVSSQGAGQAERPPGQEQWREW